MKTINSRLSMFCCMAVLALAMASCKKDSADNESGAAGGTQLTGTSWVFQHDYYDSTIEFEHTYTLIFTKEGGGTHTKTGWRRVRYSMFAAWGEKENVNEVNEVTCTYDTQKREGYITEYSRQPFYISPDFQKLTWGNNIYTRKN